MAKKKTKVVNVKQKLHHPVKPKKKSHLGEYFAELIIIILFLGSIAITVYKYLGKGKFNQRRLNKPVSINTDGSVGFNITKSNGSTTNGSTTNGTKSTKTSDDGNSSLEIYSKDNNVFDISSYSDSVYVDFKSKSVTVDNTTLGNLTINDTNIFSLLEQTIPISGQAGGKIQFANNGYNLDCYGRFKGKGIVQNTSSGAIFNGGVSAGGCKDTSLITQFLVPAMSMPRGYLSKDPYVKPGTGGIVDNYISTKTGDSGGTWHLVTTPSGDGISLNSTNLLTFPISGGNSNAIVLPYPTEVGNFINFIFYDGPSLPQPSSGFLIRNLSFRCTTGAPFVKNSVLRSINFQQAITTMSGNDKYIKYSDFGSSQTVHDNSDQRTYIDNMFLTNGSSNIIFLNVFSRNDYTRSSFRFNADGTTVKFVCPSAGVWAVEGDSYSDSAFFTQKTT